MESRSYQYNQLEDLFDMTTSNYHALRLTRKEIGLLKSVIDLSSLVQYHLEEWKETLWSQVDTEYLTSQVKLLRKQIREMPQNARVWEIYVRLDAKTNNLSKLLPLITELHSEAVKERHWKSIMSTTHKHFDKGPDFKLRDLFELDMHNHIDAVREIIDVAHRELKIEKRLDSIEKVWSSLSLQFVLYREESETYVLANTDPIIEYLEEHQMQLQSTISMGKSAEYFRDRITYWQRILGIIETTLSLWLQLQRQWQSLEAIFLESGTFFFTRSPVHLI